MSMNNQSRSSHESSSFSFHPLVTIMQSIRRFVQIRWFSSSIVNVTPSTTEKELQEISKLMKHYNNSHAPIRTYALFQWMLNIINLKPDFTCYLHIIRACNELNNPNTCKKIHQCIEQDRTLEIDEHRQLRIKLLYMYAKIKNMDLAEHLFHQIRENTNASWNAILYGTMFKAYNMNGQPEKTIELYENDVRMKKSIELDAISATCVLNACSDCHRLDVGEYVHQEVRRLKLLDPPNLRLATAIMDMYCNCGSINRARELFDQLLPIVDQVAYSTLMKAYLSLHQPMEVLNLFKQFQSSSLPSDSVFYLNAINAGNQLGLQHQAEYIHRSIPSNLIEKNRSLQTSLINMHAHCLHLNEADRLFHSLKHKDNHSLGNLIHGYAIHGQGQRAWKLFRENQSRLKYNEYVYRMMLYACVFTGGLVNEARDIYRIIPNDYKTAEVAAAMVSVLARDSLFDEIHSFIQQYQSTSQNVKPLWSDFFMACYHSGYVQQAKLIYEKIPDDPIVALLFSDMINSLPSNEVVNYFRQEKSGICWTEIPNDDTTGYTVHEFHDTPASNSELNVMIDELKGVGIDWGTRENDLKELFCGHMTLRSAIAQNLVSTLPNTSFQLTKTKPICSVCHEGLKQLTILRQRDIILRDSKRVHHFHHGHCSCHDQF